MNELLETIARKALENQQTQDGDYTDPETGLLMCGTCKTPRQHRLNGAGYNGIVPVMCKCRLEKLEAEKKEAERLKAEERLKLRKEACFGGSKHKADCVFADDDRRDANASDIATGYARHFAEMRERGKGLVLLGACGTGKTFLACCIANALLEQGYTAKVTTFAEIANALQAGFDKQSVYDELNRVDLLVLDDFDSERDTSYMNEVVFTVIDQRTAAQKPVIVTTNLEMKDFKTAATIERNRVLSRLKETCIPFAVKGTDRREDKLKASYQADIALLKAL